MLLDSLPSSLNILVIVIVLILMTSIHPICISIEFAQYKQNTWTSGDCARTECWDITSIYLMRVKSSLTKYHVPVLKALLPAMYSSTPQEPSSAAMSVPFQCPLCPNTVS